jgi:hypothetical protein
MKTASGVFDAHARLPASHVHPLTAMVSHSFL